MKYEVDIDGELYPNCYIVRSKRTIFGRTKYLMKIPYIQTDWKSGVVCKGTMIKWVHEDKVM